MYLGHRHLHLRGTELVDILLKKSNELAPKVGVRKQFGFFRVNENGQEEISIAYGAMSDDGEVKLESD